VEESATAKELKTMEERIEDRLERIESLLARIQTSS
jgi:hypothetical protein